MESWVLFGEDKVCEEMVGKNLIRKNKTKEKKVRRSGMREKLPDRRASWVQKVKIDGTSYYLTCGEYEDGRLGEIWIDAHKYGSFSRGVLDSLARQVSVALQNGTPVLEVVKCLRDMSFPPDGPVTGSPYVESARSVADWIAQELEVVYVQKQDKSIYCDIHPMKPR